jgi:YfiH family protein
MLNAEGFCHAFFTRSGGVSSGPYATLNLSSSVGDSPFSVAENLVRAANWLDLDASSLCCAKQVHGSDVLVLDRDSSLDKVRTTPADALIALGGHLACCVCTADCVPVLVADRKRGCVAAIHAGWRGIVAGIVPRTLLRLGNLGSKQENLVAAIGPHIRVGAFEVSDDVGRLISSATPHAAVIQCNFGVRPHVALVAALREQLRQAGLNDAQIDDVGGCTFEESDRFFSYRRMGPVSGRQLHAILPRGPAR